MTRRYDELTFRRRLRDALCADKLWSRMFSRGILLSGIDPPVPLIWGGTIIGYRFWWSACFLVSILVPAVYPLLLPFLVLFAGPAIVYHEIPQFLPECFAYIHFTNTSQFKRFREGLDQLLQEGVTQALQVLHAHTKLPVQPPFMTPLVRIGFEHINTYIYNTI